MKKSIICSMILVVLLSGACKSKPKPVPVSEPANTRVPTTGAVAPAATTSPSDTTTTTVAPDTSTGSAYGTASGTVAGTTSGTESGTTSDFDYNTTSGITSGTESGTTSDVESNTTSGITSGSESETTSDDESNTASGITSGSESGTTSDDESNTASGIASGAESGTTSDPSVSIINRHQSGIILDGATTYTVLRRDTLSGIAKKVYKDGSLYPLISMVSEGITNPDYILPGTRLTIPVVSVNMNDPEAKAAIDRYFLQIAQYEAQRGRRGTAEMIRNHTK